MKVFDPLIGWGSGRRFRPVAHALLLRISGSETAKVWTPIISVKHQIRLLLGITSSNSRGKSISSEVLMSSMCFRCAKSILLAFRKYNLCREKNMIGRKPNLPHASSRRCPVCGIEKPLTVDNFQIAPSFANGFSFYCNDCDLELRKQKTFTREEFKLDIVDDAESIDDKQNP